MTTHEDEFVKKLENAMRAEFFPHTQIKEDMESMEQQMRDRFTSRFPNLCGELNQSNTTNANNPSAGLSELARQLEEGNSTGLNRMTAQAGALQSLAQKLQDLPPRRRHS